MSCYKLDKFSITVSINFFHPNLELESKRLELAFLFQNHLYF
ncbi:hypothetical protein CGSSp19BS75_10628 [Streptococcus pneumoniae SP19-BS75]|nr:hypothetical protein CGSSp19BS75_10628 [Streptococcus pneumoniae SP19-BS75]EFL68164.1 hypothetical protein CGSSp14BS292_01658 [Streptococcus pneumoniae SP14-BS292]EFL68679.1 hypothetical protein CGSSpBS293_03878 [Streptococcus pneumoniae SP-BS293]EFL71848.1 hypothetical protein CGSSpBS458_07524 [Streptococcus pneumoniae BS458]EFL77165.1 hypothetical protein CGSSpBS397_02341 [Streptococcus pneumoniae BS397]